MTKACDISTTMVSAEFVNLEATKPFFRNTCCFKNANKICATLLKVAFRNCKLEDLSFFTEKGADVSVRDIKTTVLFTSLLYRIVLILSSYYWVKERLLNYLTEISANLILNQFLSSQNCKEHNYNVYKQMELMFNDRDSECDMRPLVHNLCFRCCSCETVTCKNTSYR